MSIDNHSVFLQSTYVFMKLRYALVYYFPIIDLEIAKLCTAVCSILFNSAGGTKDLCNRNKCCGFSEQGNYVYRSLYTSHNGIKIGC